MAKKRGYKGSLPVRMKRRARYIYLKLLRIDDPPERIARGAALGVLMGVLPTFGLGTALAFGIAFIIKANKAAAVLGSFVMNPFTSAFVWTLSIVIGSVLTGEDYSDMLSKLRRDGVAVGVGWAYLVFLVGNVILSTLLTVASYVMVKKAIIRHRLRKKVRLAEERRTKGYA